jgi:hypothetical protein
MASGDGKHQPSEPRMEKRQHGLYRKLERQTLLSNGLRPIWTMSAYLLYSTLSLF